MGSSRRTFGPRLALLAVLAVGMLVMPGGADRSRLDIGDWLDWIKDQVTGLIVGPCIFRAACCALFGDAISK